MSLLESEKSFLKCQKEKKKARERKGNERKGEKKVKGKKIPPVPVSKAKTGSFVYKSQEEKT